MKLMLRCENKVQTCSKTNELGENEEKYDTRVFSYGKMCENVVTSKTYSIVYKQMLNRTSSFRQIRKLTFLEAGKQGKAHVRCLRLLNSAKHCQLNNICHWLMEPRMLEYVHLQHL